MQARGGLKIGQGRNFFFRPLDQFLIRHRQINSEADRLGNMPGVHDWSTVREVPISGRDIRQEIPIFTRLSGFRIFGGH